MFYGYPEYVSVAEKRRKAETSIEELKKKNPGIKPIVINGRTLATTWWGKSWNDNLEKYSDYANRIDRGRSYVRHGAVLDLQMTKGSICALVQGSKKKPYAVTITIKPLEKKIWETMKVACEGKLDSLQELIEGKFPKGLTELFTAKGDGLFPAPKEIVLKCSCPDSAIMCKHVAAVLYGVGARLDDDPTLFFELRDVNIDDLISEAIEKKSKTLINKSKTKSGRVIEEADISDLFGIDMEGEAQKPVKKAVGKTVGKTVGKIVEKVVEKAAKKPVKKVIEKVATKTEKKAIDEAK